MSFGRWFFSLFGELLELIFVNLSAVCFVGFFLSLYEGLEVLILREGICASVGERIPFCYTGVLLKDVRLRR